MMTKYLCGQENATMCDCFKSLCQCLCGLILVIFVTCVVLSGVSYFTTQHPLNGWATVPAVDGSTYEGLWDRGNFTRGTWHQRQKDKTILVYEGEWAWFGGTRSQLHGWGVKRVMEGPGNYTYGKGVVVYEGQWSQGTIHGKGTLKSGGEIYIGEFKNGKRSGNGRVLYEDGGSYIGEWRNDKYHGHGVRLLVNGDRYNGEWDRGLEQDKKNWEVHCHYNDIKAKQTDVENKLQEAEAKWRDAQTRLQDAEAKQQDTETKLRDASVKYQDTQAMWYNAQARLQDTEAEQQDTEIKLMSATATLQDTEAKLQDTEAKLQDTEAKLQDTEAKLQDAEAKWEYAERKWHEAKTKWQDTDTQWQNAKAALQDTEVKQQIAETKWQAAEAKLIATGLTKGNTVVDNPSIMERTIFHLKLWSYAITSILTLALAFVFYTQNKHSKINKVVSEDSCIYVQHILQHIQGGAWVKRLPQSHEKELNVTFESNNFQEAFCCSCPLEKVIKMSIQNRFGVDTSHQKVYIVKRHGEEPLSPLLTLSQCLEDYPALHSIRVEMKPVLEMMKTDLTLGKQIGGGSYGKVYESEHKRTKERFAVKELHSNLNSPFYLNKFQREAETVAALEHPNIVKFIGTCPPVSELWIVSELLGCNLACLIAQKKKLTIEEATVVSWGIAKGMEAIHRHNYMHRDLSSKNIVFDASGVPKICDFGMALKVVPRDNGMTYMPGTPFYMAPQMQTLHYTIAGDMWQFAILMSEMICGQIQDTENIRSLKELQSHLSKSAKEEVRRLLTERDIDGNTVARYLERRDTCLKRVVVELGTSNLYPKSTHILEKVVEWCLSVVENERPPFSLIVQLLYSCLTSCYFESCPSPYGQGLTESTSSNTTTSGWQIPPAYESDITSRISACYSTLAPLTRQKNQDWAPSQSNAPVRVGE
ncbi:skeleton-binding protein 1 [Pelomyxa schiedti]|nr:skeleton-binding protein 1 [Pelomyxa schiedti]